MSGSLTFFPPVCLHGADRDKFTYHDDGGTRFLRNISPTRLYGATSQEKVVFVITDVHHVAEPCQVVA